MEGQLNFNQETRDSTYNQHSWYNRSEMVIWGMVQFQFSTLHDNPTNNINWSQQKSPPKKDWWWTTPQAFHANFLDATDVDLRDFFYMDQQFTGLVEGKIYRKPLFFAPHLGFSCRCFLKPIQWTTVWWFQSFFIFHNICDNPSHWLIFFKMGKTTNQTMILTKKKRKKLAPFQQITFPIPEVWTSLRAAFSTVSVSWRPKGVQPTKMEGFSKKRWNHMEYVWCTVISLDFWHMWELITLKLDPSTLNVGLPIFGNFWKWWARIGFGFAYTYTLHFWTWPNMVRFYPQNVCVFHWKKWSGILGRKLSWIIPSEMGTFL